MTATGPLRRSWPARLFSNPEHWLTYLAPLVPVALLAALLVGEGVATEQRYLETYMSELAGASAAIVSERIHATFQVMRSYALRFRFREEARLRDVEKCRQHLQQLMTLDTSLDRCFLADPSGVLFADHPAVPEVTGQSFAERDWYRGVSRRWEPYLSVPYKRRAPPAVTVVAFAVPLLEEARAVGLLVGQIRTNLLESQLTPIAPSDTSDILVATRTGQIVASTRGTLGNAMHMLADGALQKMIFSGAEGMFEDEPSPGKKPVLAFCSPIPRTSWVLCILESRETVTAQLRGVQRRFLLLCALLYVALVSLLQLRRNKALALAAAAEDLRHKNEQLESLVTTVSHDLKSPMVSIHGLVNILLEDHAPHLDAQAQRYLGMLRVNSDRMRLLIDDILRFSRIGPASLPLETVDTRATLDRVLQELEPLVASRGARICIAGEFPILETSATGFYQVLANLAGNALKFLGDQPEPAVEIGGRLENGVYSLWVKDNGVGIDPAYQERIFQPFHRLQDVQTEGSGIGLAIVKRIVETLGGRIAVESRRGAGSTFRVELPRHG